MDCIASQPSSSAFNLVVCTRAARARGGREAHGLTKMRAERFVRLIRSENRLTSATTWILCSCSSLCDFKLEGGFDAARGPRILV